MNEVRGTVSYRVPIVVPPGTAGHTPEVALAYSTEKVTGGAGWVGVGWSVAGASAIERDRRFGVPYNFEAVCGSGYCYRDDFVLDGSDLLCANSTCTGGGYKTQVDDGREITYLGATAGWRIRDREGRTLLYGATSTTRLVNPKNGQVFSWLLESVTDVSGNWIQYAYAAGTGVLYPSEITYAQSGAAANRRVKFLRMTRPDVALDYTAGFRRQVDQRLSQIEVRAGAGSGSLVTRYDLVHVQAADSNRSLLASVQRFGANGTTSLPPWEFDYQASGHTFGDQAEYQSSYFYGLPVAFSEGYGVVSAGSVELNGDALPDYLHRDTLNNNVPAGGAGTQWIPNLGLPVLDATLDPPAPGYLHAYQPWSSSVFLLSDKAGDGTVKQLIDLDGDRLTDALDGGLPGASPCAWTVRRGNGSSFAGTASAWQNVPSYSGTWAAYYACAISYTRTDLVVPIPQLVALVDLTGDGRPDRVIAMPNHAGSWQVAINQGWNAATGTGSFSNPKAWPEPSLRVIEETNGMGSSDPLLADLNGDGLPDHLWYSAGWKVAYNYGGGFDALESLPGASFTYLRRLTTGTTGGYLIDLIDLNGDGLVDRLEWKNSPDRIEVWFGTGTGFKATAIVWQPGGAFWHPNDKIRRDPSNYGTKAIELRDLNGDGLVDRAKTTFHSYFNGDVVFNAGPYPDVMSAASSPLGGVLQLEYGAAASQPNAQGTTPNGNLPMARWVVTKTTRSDGRVGTPQIVDTYLYRNAGYDRAEREFRGFGEVVQSSLLTGGAVESTATSTYQIDRACTGQLAAGSVAGSALTYAQESHTYLTTTPLPAGVDPTRQWVACLPSESLVTSVEGGSGPARTHKTKREYGTPINALYNLTVLREYGEWNTSTGQDVLGDERFTFFQYATATDANYYVVSRPTRVEVQSGAGAQAQLTQLFYDGNTNTNAVRGRLTAVDGWLNTPAPARWVRQATLAYDAYGNVVSRTGPTTTYDANGFQETTAFDTTYLTFPIQAIEGPDTSTPLTTTIAYSGCLDGVAPPEGLGLPCTVTSSQGAITTFRYDTLARLDKLQRPTGLKEIVTYTLPVPSGPAETLVQRTLDFVAAVPDLVFKQYLDGFGRTYREESPGKITETIVTKRTFDSRGRVATETQPHFSTVPTPLQRVLGYDPLGRVKSVLDFDAGTQRILAYKPWELVEETYFGTVQASNRKQHEESAFDGLGRLKEVRSFPDAVGLGTSFKITASYDAADRLLSVNDPVAASGNPSTFCSTHAMGSACPTQIHTTQVVWDLLGRKLQINDPDAGVWSWEYFDSGLLKKQTNGSAAAIERSYDGLERVVSQTLTPTGNGAYNASFTYGTTAGADYGRLKTAISTGGAAYTYWHDVPGRMTAMWQTSAGLTFKNDYSYDELDRRTGRRFPDQVWFYQDYDGLRMTKIRSDNGDRWALRTASYDAYGRPVALELGRHATGDWPAAKLDYEYAGPGARLSKITGRRYTSASTSTVVMDQTSAFDGLGRLTSQGGAFNGQAISRSYGYDGLSRLTTASGPWETTASVNWTFGYDPLGDPRTLGSSSGAYSRAWSYSNASRPRFLSSFVETGGGSPVSDTVTAEAGGNVGTRTRNSVAETFTWNAQNRLYAISGRGFANHYDAFGRRDRQRVDVGAIHTDLVYVADDFEYDTQLQQGNRFFFVGGQRIASFASTFVPAETGPWIDLEWVPPLLPPAAVGLGLFGLFGLGATALRRRPPVWIASGGVGLLGGTLVLLPLPARAAPTQLGSHSDANGVYYLGDHLGSTRAVIDWAGALVETRDYDPFGRDIAHTGSYQLKHRFTSQPVNETESTATSPLYNYGARFYDPKWGRFISPDERVEGFDSQGLNPYGYARNQPTSRRDPTGQISVGGITDVLDGAYFDGRWSQDVRADLAYQSAVRADRSAASRSGGDARFGIGGGGRYGAIGVALGRIPGLRAPTGGSTTSEPSASKSFGWVYWPTEYRAVIDRFGDTGTRLHDGLDIRARLGSDIFAAGEGVVMDVYSTLRGGGQIRILHNDGSVTGYAHVDPGVRVGDRVAGGQFIGSSNASGRVSAAHLHFTFRRTRSSEKIDPSDLIGPE